MTIIHAKKRPFRRFLMDVDFCPKLDKFAVFIDYLQPWEQGNITLQNSLKCNNILSLGNIIE